MPLSSKASMRSDLSDSRVPATSKACEQLAEKDSTLSRNYTITQATNMSHGSEQENKGNPTQPHPPRDTSLAERIQHQVPQEIFDMILKLTLELPKPGTVLIDRDHRQPIQLQVTKKSRLSLSKIYYTESTFVLPIDRIQPGSDRRELSNLTRRWLAGLPPEHRQFYCGRPQGFSFADVTSPSTNAVKAIVTWLNVLSPSDYPSIKFIGLHSHDPQLHVTSWPAAGLWAGNLVVEAMSQASRLGIYLPDPSIVHASCYTFDAAGNKCVVWIVLPKSYNSEGAS